MGERVDASALVVGRNAEVHRRLGSSARKPTATGAPYTRCRGG